MNTTPIIPAPVVKAIIRVRAISRFVKYFKFITGSSALFSIIMNTGRSMIKAIK